jgi:hypothetical protein
VELELLWRLNFEGEVFREEDLTIEECERVVAITDTPWTALQPTASPTALVAVLAVFLARKGKDVAATMVELRKRSAVELLKCVDWGKDDLPSDWELDDGKLPVPKEAEPEPSSTTSSSSELSDSDGTPTESVAAPDET